MTAVQKPADRSAESFTYHPRTADQLDISPTSDGLGVLIGIYNNRDNGQYTTVDVAIPDVESIIGALRRAKAQAARQPSPQCEHEDLSCPRDAPCGDYSYREGRDG